jgi:hypothetical protein
VLQVWTSWSCTTGVNKVSGAPSFFEGDPSVFDGLRFNVEHESFQFCAPVKMKDDRAGPSVQLTTIPSPLPSGCLGFCSACRLSKARTVAVRDGSGALMIDLTTRDGARDDRLSPRS